MKIQDSVILESILETLDGTIITDEKGIIVFLSQKYAESLNINVNDAVGRHVREVIPQTRMDIVVKTGLAEIGSVHWINEVTPVVCNRLPIKKDGKIVGAVAITTFRKIDEVNGLVEEINRLNSEVRYYKSELGKLQVAKYSLERIIGSSKKIRELKELIRKIASSTLTVLVNGDTGTGKELVAHAIHQLSPRWHKPFIRINCAAIPNDLLESELFGYEEGAFTGAKKNGKPGKFELANGGTILLDEINELPLYLQSKLLRVIQELEIERVGGIRTIKLDVRFICSTNKNLEDLIARGEFREDLYYRIHVVEIHSPSLKERKEDLKLLAEYFVKKANKEHGLNITHIHEDVLELFQKYHWPGNIRELEHVIKRAAAIALKGELGIEYFEYLLPRILASSQDCSSYRGVNFQKSLAEIKAAAEKQAIINALAKYNGNKTLAAKELQIHRTVLYQKIKKYIISI